jgi:hypothetical protein
LAGWPAAERGGRPAHPAGHAPEMPGRLPLLFLLRPLLLGAPAPAARAVGEQLTVRSWDVLGPFAVGKTEIDAEPMGHLGGIEAIPRADRTTYPSELAPRGYARWWARSNQSGQAGHAVAVPSPPAPFREPY